MRQFDLRPETELAREARDQDQMAALHQILQAELEDRLLVAPANPLPSNVIVDYRTHEMA